MAQLVTNEVTANSPQSLQAVKLLAQYLGSKLDKVSVQGLGKGCCLAIAAELICRAHCVGGGVRNTG